MGRGGSDLHRSLYELKDEVAKLQTELQHALVEFSSDLGINTQDIIETVEPETLVQFLTSQGNNKEMVQRVNEAVFTTGATIQSICKGL